MSQLRQVTRHMVVNLPQISKSRSYLQEYIQYLVDYTYNKGIKEIPAYQTRSTTLYFLIQILAKETNLIKTNFKALEIIYPFVVALVCCRASTWNCD